MKQQIKILSYILFLSNSLFSQIENDSLDNIKIEPKLSVFDSIKKTFVNHSEVSCFDSMWMKELSNNELSVIQFEDILKINPDENVIYDLNTDVLKERLAKLDAKSPFNIEYNLGLENVIKSLLKNRKKSYERLLGISQYYFPLFEEALSKYNIPIEVKYLAIVESALNPKAKSRVGATGLWQFMYNTGLQYKLDVNSYIDERSDPIKATEAACKYLSGMYNIFGDWDLVLASYNCGPGNVTKAIRRSNGQTNYWNIRKNLPKETAGYLPAFLATMYIMEYHNEHGINKPKALVNYFATDTIIVKKQLSFNQISRLIDISEAELQFLNPSYKLNVIPVIENKINYLRLPQEKIAVFTSNEDKIYYFANYEANLREKPNKEPVYVKDSLSFYTSEKKYVTKFKKYKVRKGDNLSEIASKFDVTISDIKKWNGLKSNKAPRGKNLKIQTTENVLVRVKHAIKPENNIANTNKKSLLEKESESRIDNIAPEKRIENSVVTNSESDNKSGEKIQEEIAYNNNKTITKEEVQKLEKFAIVNTKPSKEDFIIKYNNVISCKDIIKSYKVKKGDNLSEIADKFNVTLSDIKIWNKLKSNAVAKGKSLKIITNEKVVTIIKTKELKKPAVEKPTESSKIVNKSKTPDEEKFEVYYANNADTNNEKQSKFIINKELVQTYNVKKSDNITTIAKELEVSVKDLKIWNNLKNNDLKDLQSLKYRSTQRVVFDSKKQENNGIQNSNSSFFKEHIVVKGDNLKNIASKYQVTINDLKGWNELENNNITIGNVLIISNPQVVAINKYVVDKGDNIWKIAEKFNTTAAKLKDWNNLTSNELKKGTALVVSESETNVVSKPNSKTIDNIKVKEKMYLVKKGDSLFSISKKYPGVTVADIKKWNDIQNGDITPGMKLKIII